MDFARNMGVPVGSTLAGYITDAGNGEIKNLHDYQNDKIK